MRWLYIMGLAAILSPSIASAQLSIVGVARTEPDRQSLSELEGILGRPIQLREVPGMTPNQIARSSSTWSARWVVMIDTADGAVLVIRPGDSVVLTRVLEPSSATPYAAAVVAAELLRIVGDTPEMQVDAGASQQELADAADRQTGGWALDASVGAEGAGDLGQGSFLLRPSIDVGVRYAPHLSQLRMSATIGGSFFGRLRRGLVEPSTDTVSYGRHDLALQFAVATQVGSAELAALVTFGLGIVTAQAETQTRDVIGESLRVSPWFGGGARFRFYLGSGFFAGLSASVAWAPEPVVYLVRGEPGLEEGPFRVIAGLSVGWTSR